MSLGRQAVRGAVWTISTSFGSRALGLVATLVVTRFVSPGDYGEVMVAAVLVMSTTQLSTLGVGQYVIAKPDAGRGAAFHASSYHILSGILAFAVLLAAGSWLGNLFEARRVIEFLPGLVLAGFIDRVSFMPERILVRDLRFGVVSGARAAGDVAYSLATVGFAMAGWGATAIVLGNLARSVFRAAVMVGATYWRDWIEPCRISLRETRAMLAFGIPISIAGLAHLASRRWDNLLISRWFGPAATGMYNLSYNLADVPAIQIGEQIGDVLLPSFSRLDPERRKAALARVLRLLGLIVFPLAVGLGIVAPTLVAVLFSPEWQPVGPMLLVLSALSVTRPVGWTIACYLQAQHRTRTVMTLEILKVAVLFGSLLTIGRISPLWACGAVGIAFGLHTLASLWTIQHQGGPSLARLLKSIVPPLVACGIMALGVLVVRFGLSGFAPHPISELVAEIAVGIVVYIGSTFLIVPDSAREIIARLRQAFRMPQPT